MFPDRRFCRPCAATAPIGRRIARSSAAHSLNRNVERTVKPQDDRKLPFDIADDDEDDGLDGAVATSAGNPWYQVDERTRRLATLVGGGYSYVTIEIVYATAAGLRQVASWEGFDIQPQFAVFRAWLAEWEAKENVQVQDLRATAVELVGEQEIALNPHILFVH